jgi:hypothetical protein
VSFTGYLLRLHSTVKLLNPAIYDRLMECLITSLGFELFENIIHMELDSTLTNNEAIGNIAIAKGVVTEVLRLLDER